MLTLKTNQEPWPSTTQTDWINETHQDGKVVFFESVQKKTVIIGAGGYTRSIPANFGFTPAYYHEHPREVGETIEGVPVDIREPNDELQYVSALFDTRHKRELVEPLEGRVKWVNLIHETAVLINPVKLGHGVVITPLSFIDRNASIGDHATILNLVTIGHDAVIGRYCFIGPSATVLGNVTTAEGVEVGANATVLPGVKVGRGAVVGAGAVVTRDVPPNQVWAGVPAKMINRVDEW